MAPILVAVIFLLAAVGGGPTRFRFVLEDPCIGCIPIETTDVAQTVIDAHPAGSSFIFRGGYHRQDSVSPRNGDIFFGSVGAILSGAKVLSAASFTVSGSNWKITGQTQTIAARTGECQLIPADGGNAANNFATSYPGCSYQEELFYDDVRQTRVESLGAVGSGKWYFDDTANEIYVGSNPSGHVIETSVTDRAFKKTADNVTISGLIIEKYATPAQYGPIDAENTTGWTVTDVELRYNHGAGTRIGQSYFIANSRSHHNGQMGITGIGDNVIVRNVEIDHNNTAHFDPGWEAGGTKFVLTNSLIVEYCNIHDNEGPGLWSDIDNFGTTYRYNTVTSNQQMGIFHEISWAADIYGNTVTGNGLAYWVPNYIWGVGILVAASPNVEIHDNILSGNRGGIAGVQQSRGSGTYGTHLIFNLNVHDNNITVNKTGINPAYAGALVDGTGSSTIFTTDNNHFEGNVYTLKTDLSSYFEWNNGERTFAQWQGFGHDTPTGSASTF